MSRPAQYQRYSVIQELKERKKKTNAKDFSFGASIQT